MTDMADALTQTAATAAQAHVSINDTVTAISEMANKGIIGSQAGCGVAADAAEARDADEEGRRSDEELGVNIYDAHGADGAVEALVEQFSKCDGGDERRAAERGDERDLRVARDPGGEHRAARRHAGVRQDVGGRQPAGRGGRGREGEDEGPPRRVQALQSAGQTLAITLGTPLLNFLAKVRAKVAGLVDWINRLAEKMGEVHGFSAKFDGREGRDRGGVGNAVARSTGRGVVARAGDR
jgi:hypothetical protein